MLTIQPVNYGIQNKNHLSFKSHNAEDRYCEEDYIYGHDLDEVEILNKRLEQEKLEYNDEKNFWEEQKQTFDELSKDTDVPSFFKKGMKIVSVAISTILGGMAMAWGSKKSIGAFEKLGKTQKVKNFTKATSKNFNSFKEMISGAYQSIKTSKFVTNITKKYDKQVTKFNNSKFAKNPIVKSVRKGFGYVTGKIKDAYKYVAKKVKGIKSENVKNATVNTMGVSGGVTSGVAALKETNKAEQGDIK